MARCRRRNGSSPAKFEAGIDNALASSGVGQEFGLTIRDPAQSIPRLGTVDTRVRSFRIEGIFPTPVYSNGVTDGR